MKKIIKRIFLALVLCFSVVLLASCGNTTTEAPTETTTEAPTEAPTEKQDLSVLKGFTASVENVFTVTTDSDAELHFTYAKGDNEDAYLKKTVSGLKGYNTLSFTVKSAGTFELMLVAGDKSISVKINSLATSFVYDWNLMEDADLLESVTEIRIYAGPSKKLVTGELDFTNITFTVKKAGATGNYTVQTGADLIPTTTIDYTGEDTVNVLGKFENNDEGIYEFTYNENGSVKIDYDKDSTYSWAYFYNQYSAIPADFVGVIFTVKGTAGTKILVKPDDNDGGDNWYTIQETDKEETFYVKLKDAGAVSKMLFFVSPGLAGSGSITFTKGELTKTPVTRISNGSVVSQFFDAGDNSYTMEVKEDKSVDVTYNVKANGWSNIQALTSLLKDKGMLEVETGLTVKVTVTGKAGDQILVKLNDKYETWYTLSGDTAESFLVAADKMPEWLTRFVVFVNPNKETDQTGTINLKFEIVEQVVAQTKVEYNGETNTVDANGYWADGNKGSEFVAAKNEDGSYTVTVNKTSQYGYLMNEYKGFEEAGFTTLILELKGEKGAVISFKPNDLGDYYKDVTLTGEKQIIVVSVPTQMKKMIMFYNINDLTATGEYTIYSATLCNLGEEVKGFVDNGDGAYTFTEVATGGYIVSYDKKATQAWSYYKVTDLALMDGAILGVIVKGAADTPILVKVNDKVENKYTLNGDLQLFQTTASDPITSIYFFLNTVDVAGKADVFIQVVALNPVTTPDTTKYTSGSSLNVNNYWADKGDKVYTITSKDGVYTVTASADKNEYSAILTKISGVTNEFNYLALTLKGTKDETVIVKPNDNGAYEKTVTFTGENQLVYIPIPENLANIVMMYQGGKKVAGSFDIVSAVLVNGTLAEAGSYITNFETHETVAVTVDGNTVKLVGAAEKDTYIYVIAGVLGSTDGLKLVVNVSNAGDATKLLVKINDSKEVWVDIVSGAASIDITSAQGLPSVLTSILLFPNGGVAGACSMDVTLQLVATE